MPGKLDMSAIRQEDIPGTSEDVMFINADSLDECAKDLDSSVKCVLPSSVPGESSNNVSAPDNF